MNILTIFTTVKIHTSALTIQHNTIAHIYLMMTTQLMSFSLMNMDGDYVSLSSDAEAQAFVTSFNNAVLFHATRHHLSNSE